MPATLVGINFTNLENLSSPTFSIGNDSTTFLTDIPVKANQMTGGFYGLIVLSALFIFLMWKLSQDAAFGGDHGYDYVRGMGIAGAICSIIGLFCLNFGYFVNFYHVVIFIVIAFIGTLATWMGER